ncbi:MAG: DMT family transporter, partial [Candidatus Melainabacteria bacterium]|nr:DMT family transporter [Candidatus Melainabacteria bacterium]
MLPITTFYLIGIIGCLWVAYDFVRKILLKRIKPLPLVIFLEFGQAVVYLSYGYLSQQLIYNHGYIFPGLMTAGFASIGTFLLTKAISISPLSSVIPFLSFLPFFTVIFGSLILKENLSLIQFSGLIILVLASLIINYQGKKVNSILGLFQTLYQDLTHEKGCVLVIITSLLWAFAIPFDKLAMQATNPISHALYHALLCGTIFSIARFFSKSCPWGSTKFLAVELQDNESPSNKEFHKMPSTYWFLLLGIINASFAMVLQFMAYQISYIGLVEAGKRAVSLVSNLFIGALIFKEPVNKFKFLGTLLILIATILILN